MLRPVKSINKEIWDDYPKLISSLIEFCHYKIIVEIGVGWGFTTLAMAQAAKLTGGKVYSYDFFGPIGEYPGDPNTTIEKVTEKMNNADIDQSLYKLTKIDSKSPEFLNIVKKDTGGKIDFAFIDGDHSYNGIRSDFLKVYPLLVEDGMIVFHDTFNHSGCRRFLLDLYQELNDGTFDFINLPFGYSQHRCGVTILTKRSYPLNQGYPRCYTHKTDKPFISVVEVYRLEKEWYRKQIKTNKCKQCGLTIEYADNMRISCKGYCSCSHIPSREE